MKIRNLKTVLTVAILVLTVTINVQAQTGINTDNPKAILDIEGDLRVSKLEKYNSSSIPLYWNATTQKLAIGNTSGNGADSPKPFYTLAYKINTAKGEDWINNFDTKISSRTYTVIITSAQFMRSADNGLYITYNRGLKNKSDVPTAVFNYGAYISNNTWRLKADYPSASPGYDTSDYYWDISLLIINNNMVTTLPKRTGNVNSSGNGSDTRSPIN